MRVNRFSNHTLIGFIIIVVGILFLLNTTNVYDTGILLRWLPSLVILYGLLRLVASGFRSLLGPVIIIAVGAFLQLMFLGVNVFMLWPAVLIAVGLSILLGRSHIRNKGRRHDVDMVDGLGIMGVPRIICTSKAFKGGQVTAVMGGVELDLRNAEIEDRPAVIDATVLMGSAEITVPIDWDVRNDAVAVMGATEDKRTSPASVTGDKPDLIISGLVMMGSIEIKD